MYVNPLGIAPSYIQGLAKWRHRRLTQPLRGPNLGDSVLGRRANASYQLVVQGTSYPDGLLPQQTTEPLGLNPQVCKRPASTSLKAPSGGEA